MARSFVTSSVYSGLLAGMLSGCQSLRSTDRCDDCLPPRSYCGVYNTYYDNYVTSATAASCANSDLKDLKKSCGKHSKDFEDGFRQAYVDLAMGRRAHVPPIPPRQYWTAYYRSCAGSQAVADWFEGYRLGLNRGSQGGVSRFNRVASSWNGEGACLSEGDPVYSDVLPYLAGPNTMLAPSTVANRRPVATGPGSPPPDSHPPGAGGNPIAPAHWSPKPPVMNHAMNLPVNGPR